ncbi:MAG TPA: serine hydrolase domain-containing protein [Jiangellaceae bacterium]|nr:serine hydrolase domain-containing protein [Jiangellaceae bacterium]
MAEVDERELIARVDEILHRRPAVGLAVGVVQDGAMVFFRGHGLADVAANIPVTADTVFRVGSITKTFTAVAVMQLLERGLVDLDAPANDYLRGYELIPRAGWPSATVRHLLTHTAGIPEVVPRSGVFRPFFGESVRVGSRVPSLPERYRGGLRLVAEPGTRFRYTDHGPATLGQIVEDVSGQPFGHYLREHVFEPLGMTDTTLARTEVERSRLATGYTLGSRGARPVIEREVVTGGAGAAYSTPRDMGLYLAALLGGGGNDHGSVLEPATIATMFQAHYQPDPRVPGIGLAFFRADAGGHSVVEHQGILPGFDSQFFVAPDDGIGVMGFTNGARRGVLWLPTELGVMLNSLIGVPDDVIRTDLPQSPEIWSDICGWYYLPGPLTDVRARGMVGAGVEVFVRRGRLHLRAMTPVPALYRGLPLHPADDKDPYMFRIDLSEFGLGALRVVFSREPEGGTTAVHLDVMPLSALKRPTVTNPRPWVEGALAVAATAVAVRSRRAWGRQHR